MWKRVLASVAGTSHTKSDLPCQDHSIVDLINDFAEQDYLVCLVSDGAGSARNGGIGAEIACKTALFNIQLTINKQQSSYLDANSVKEWILAVQTAIQQKATSKQLTSRDYACTLLGTVIAKAQALFFQIGDGAIIASSGYAQGVVFWPEAGIYANMTHFVTEADALTHLNILITKSYIDEIALFSDGIQRLALVYENQTPYLPFFDPMLEIMRNKSQAECIELDKQLAIFLNSHEINKRTDDDKTLILATRR
ncbi:hypothetical protein TI05_05260 [Achromatium sp. WMS3]|nr:hypothetical protein TI05_05260 [Achromatium sp. WMS3]